MCMGIALERQRGQDKSSSAHMRLFLLTFIYDPTINQRQSRAGHAVFPLGFKGDGDVGGGGKDVRKQAYLSKLANIINYPVRYSNVANLTTCHNVVDEHVSKANSSFAETSVSNWNVM